jgi:hypothetical protein
MSIHNLALWLRGFLSSYSFRRYCGRSDHGPTDNSALAGLLCLESLEFEVLPLNLGVLRRHSPLQIIFLLLASLHLITDQSAADQPNWRAQPRFQIIHGRFTGDIIGVT